MTRRHDERWAVPTGPNEYIHHLEAEFFRLREVERARDATIDFLRSERDRFKAATDELVRERDEARSEREDVLAQLERLQIPARHLSDQWDQREGFDQDDWDALREALPTWTLMAVPERLPESVRALEHSADPEVLRQSLERIADPETYDLDARAMRRDAESALQGAEINPVSQAWASRADELRQALTALLERYVALASSGDAGRWDPDTDPDVVAARQVLP